MLEERPDPDALLKAVTDEEKKVLRGRLKVFLGMSAGVGKTYSMLEDAHHQIKEGADVVVGIVATHGREDTARLLEGLEVLAPKIIEYKGTLFEELDLESVLKRKPELVLIDELAHTNIPGSRHLKRYQDVLELLDNGIDVSTTINVQHIESLKDMVETITGVPIRETVPDSILENATNIELIDLTPDALLERLSEGKVYLGSQANIAKDHFFREDRLTALRELALRFAAEKVDHELHTLYSKYERTYRWKARERLLVAVSPSPHSQKLIRTTRRLAFTLNVPWLVVYVDTGALLDDEDAQNLAKNLNLARELGAEVITTQDSDVVTAIQRVARQKNVTQIIVGRPPKTGIFGFFEKYPLLDRLATDCSDIDVHVIRQEPISESKIKPLKYPHTGFGAYCMIFCYVLALTAITFFLEPHLGYRVSGFIFLLAILASSFYFRIGPLIFGSILYGLIWDYFFVPPSNAFSIFFSEDSVMMLLYLTTALVTGLLSNRERLQKEMLIKREKSAEALYDIVREIATNPSRNDVLKSIKRQIGAILHGRCELIIHDKKSDLNFDDVEGFVKDAKEKAAALWVFKNGSEAGKFSSTLPSTLNFYIPLKGHHEMMGVLAYRPHSEVPLTPDEKNFLYTVSQQLAYYLERTRPLH